MTLAELSMLAGLPCALSMLTLIFHRPNVHYVCVGAWAGVLLRYLDMSAPNIFTLGAFIMFSGHLSMIIRNENIIEKLRKKVLLRDGLSRPECLLPEKRQGDGDSTQQGDDDLENGDKSRIDSGEVRSGDGGQGRGHHCRQDVQPDSNSNNLFQDRHLHS